MNVQAGCSGALQQHWTVNSPEYAAVGAMLVNEGSGHADDPNAVGFVEHARSLETIGS